MELPPEIIAQLYSLSGNNYIKYVSKEAKNSSYMNNEVVSVLLKKYFGMKDKYGRPDENRIYNVLSLSPEESAKFFSKYTKELEEMGRDASVGDLMVFLERIPLNKDERVAIVCGAVAEALKTESGETLRPKNDLIKKIMDKKVVGITTLKF